MKFRRILPLLFLLLLMPVLALAAETPWGRVKVVSIGDAPMSTSKMWAPQAVMPGLEHCYDMYLEYRYCRMDTNNRVYQLRLVDGQGKQKNYNGEIDIIIPYPCKWNREEECYWKWTKAYAQRYNWAYSLGYSAFVYDGENQAAGYYVPSKVYPNGYGIVDPGQLGFNHKNEKNKFLFDVYKEELAIANDNMIALSTKPSVSRPHGWTNYSFIPVEPNDSYGHRITLVSHGGYLPSVCMQLYDKAPSFDSIKITKLLDQESMGDLFVSLYKVTYLDGFKVDNRDEASKHKYGFYTYLSRQEHCLHHHKFMPAYYPLEDQKTLKYNGHIFYYK